MLLAALGLALSPQASAPSPPLAGIWEGVFHGGRGDRQVALVCRPRGGHSLAGTFYMDGEEVGPIEDARVTADSVTFRVIDFSLLGARSGGQLAFRLVVPHGRAHEFSLDFVSADSTALPHPVTAAGRAPKPSRVAWETVPDSVLALHAARNDTSSGTLDCLRRGTLLLVGGGPSQDDLAARFVRLAGGPSARVVVIPTASVEPADSAGVDAQGANWARVLGLSSVTMLHNTSRKEADSEEFVRPLRHATGVWLSGGEARRILVSYLGTRTERELLALLGRGGVIGGTSAGALVWGSECMVFRARADGSPYQMGRPGDLMVGDPHGVCFGVLRNVLITPHFTEFKMQSSVEKTLTVQPGVLAIGIDEATALEIRGDVCTVLGRGSVTIFDGHDRGGRSFLRLKDGARYDLRKRAAL